MNIVITNFGYAADMNCTGMFIQNQLHAPSARMESRRKYTDYQCNAKIEETMYQTKAAKSINNAEYTNVNFKV